MRVLTVTGAWAWAIIFAAKDVENRSWQATPGPMAVHVGRPRSKAHRQEINREVAQAIRLAWGRGKRADGLIREMQDGAVALEGQIIGTVDVASVTRESVSPWAQWGNYFWMLEKPRRIHPIVARGKLGFWLVPTESLHEVV